MNFESLRVKDLRQELGNCGLSTIGIKSSLILRLQEYHSVANENDSALGVASSHSVTNENLYAEGMSENSEPSIQNLDVDKPHEGYDQRLPQLEQAIPLKTTTISNEIPLDTHFQPKPNLQKQNSTNVDSEFCEGIVKWFKTAKGYGFISPDEGNGSLVLVRSKDIKTGASDSLTNDRQTLTSGACVVFQRKTDTKGNVCAVNVEQFNLEPEELMIDEDQQTTALFPTTTEEKENFDLSLTNEKVDAPSPTIVNSNSTSSSPVAVDIAHRATSLTSRIKSKPVSGSSETESINAEKASLPPKYPLRNPKIANPEILKGEVLWFSNLRGSIKFQNSNDIEKRIGFHGDWIVGDSNGVDRCQQVEFKIGTLNSTNFAVEVTGPRRVPIVWKSLLAENPKKPIRTFRNPNFSVMKERQQKIHSKIYKGNIHFDEKLNFGHIMPQSGGESVPVAASQIQSLGRQWLRPGRPVEYRLSYIAGKYHAVSITGIREATFSNAPGQHENFQFRKTFESRQTVRSQGWKRRQHVRDVSQQRRPNKRLRNNSFNDERSKGSFVSGLTREPDVARDYDNKRFEKNEYIVDPRSLTGGRSLEETNRSGIAQTQTPYPNLSRFPSQRQELYERTNLSSTRVPQQDSTMISQRHEDLPYRTENNLNFRTNLTRTQGRQKRSQRRPDGFRSQNRRGPRRNGVKRRKERSRDAPTYLSNRYSGPGRRFDETRNHPAQMGNGPQLPPTRRQTREVHNKYM